MSVIRANFSKSSASELSLEEAMLTVRLDYPRSREAFCLRMLHKKYFNVSNRWYAPTLRVSKMAIVR